MTFESIIGQRRIKQFFEKALANSRLSHAYLLVGGRGLGKEAFAIALAKAFFCEKGGCGADSCRQCSRVVKLAHPDLYVIFPAPANLKEEERSRVVTSITANPYYRTEIWANPSISIAKIREVRRHSNFKSLEGKGRVVILFDCERMTVEAANALLKILEEPPDKMHLIMTSSRPSMLLPTITSRCQAVKFDPLSEQEIMDALMSRRHLDEADARMTARMAGGSYRKALDLLEENRQAFHEQALAFFRKSIQSDFDQILFVEELLRHLGRDSKQVKEVLDLLSLWFRDALIFRECDETSHRILIHQDETAILAKFNRSFPHADLHEAVDEIDRSLDLIDRNVQVNLILIVLLNKLRTYMRR